MRAQPGGPGRAGPQRCGAVGGRWGPVPPSGRPLRQRLPQRRLNAPPKYPLPPLRYPRCPLTLRAASGAARAAGPNRPPPPPPPPPWPPEEEEEEGGRGEEPSREGRVTWGASRRFAARHRSGAARAVRPAQAQSRPAAQALRAGRAEGRMEGGSPVVVHGGVRRCCKGFPVMKEQNSRLSHKS